MSVLDDGAFAPLRLTESRPLGCGAGFALAAAVAFLFHRAAPGAPAIMPAGLAGVSGLAALALALTLDDAALPNLTRALAAGVGLLVLCALVGPEPRLTLVSFASAAFGVGLAVWLARSARIRVSAAPCGAVRRCARAAVRLRDLSRARLTRSDDRRLHDLSRHCDDGRPIGRRGRLAAAAQRRCPIHHPRLFLGAGIGPRPPTGADRADVARALYFRAARPLRRAGRLGAGDPGARLRRRAGLARDAQPATVLGLGVAAVFVAYPAAMAVAARGMPDVGGLVLVVCALKLAERLARLLALRQGHDARVEPMTRRVAVALALTLYAMFAFRRWYAFAAAGIVVMLALEVGIDRAEERRALSLEGRGRGGGARRSDAARALKPGPRRLGAEPGRA